MMKASKAGCKRRVLECFRYTTVLWYAPTQRYYQRSVIVDMHSSRFLARGAVLPVRLESPGAATIL